MDLFKRVPVERERASDVHDTISKDGNVDGKNVTG